MAHVELITPGEESSVLNSQVLRPPKTRRADGSVAAPDKIVSNIMSNIAATLSIPNERGDG